MRRTRILLTTSLVGLAFSAALLAQVAGTAREVAVTAIVDGDTVWVERAGERVQVRVHGIDAPERPQPFGSEASAFASRTLLHKRVLIAPRGTDRHDRLVAAITIDGRDFAELLVSRGFAWHDTRFAPRAFELAMAERAARDARRGLWSAPSPQAPWDFRRAEPRQSSREPVAYRGNRNSRVFHAPGCLDYGCASCTIPLASIDDARSRGFRPHAACVR